METKLMLLICLACQCSIHAASAQGCNQAHYCSPVLNGKMCASDDLQKCCSAQCTFKQLGNVRAMYDIQEITHIARGTSSTCAEKLFATLTEEGYLRNRVVANPVGNTCPVEGTCDLYQCANVIGQHDSHVFINEDYVTTVQAVTSSQSMSVSFSSKTLTSTNTPVQSSPSTQQKRTNLRTSSPSDRQSVHLAPTVSHNRIGSMTPSQTSPQTYSGSADEQAEVIVAGVSAAVLLCILIIILVVMCLTLLFIRGRRMSDKSRVMESHIDEYEEIPQRIQHSPTHSQTSVTLEVTNVTHTYSVLEDPSARQHWNNPTYEIISPTHARSSHGLVYRAEPLDSNPERQEPVYSNPQVIKPTQSKPQVKEPTYSDPDADHLTSSPAEMKMKEQHTYRHAQPEEPVYSQPLVTKPTHSQPRMKEPTYDDPDANIFPGRAIKGAEPGSHSPQRNELPAGKTDLKQATHSNPLQGKEPVYSVPQVQEPVTSIPEPTEPAKLPEYKTVIRQGGKKVTATLTPQHSSQSLGESSTEGSSITIPSTPEHCNVFGKDGKNATLNTNTSSDHTKPDPNNTSANSTPCHQEYSTVIRQEGKKITATLVLQQLDSEPHLAETTKGLKSPPTMNILEGTTTNDQQVYSMVVRKNGEKVSVRVRAQSDAD